MRTHSTPRTAPTRLERRDPHTAQVRRVALIRPGAAGFSIVADPAPRRTRGAGPVRRGVLGHLAEADAAA